MIRLLALPLAGLLLVPIDLAIAQGAGSAMVKVEFEPGIDEGTIVFGGTPSGEIDLAVEGEAQLSATDLAAGSHESVLEELDPSILAAGYELQSIACDDQASSTPSAGDVTNRHAAFRVDDGEAVTCTFRFEVPGCVCPEEGAWRVQNHTGQMVCTGAFSMTQPLAPSQGSGTIEVEDGCQRVVASGMSEDEATIVMRPTADCSYVGSVGGEQDGIPMTIHFTWNVPDSERITGNLESTVSQGGMTCRMSRTYELDFEG